MTPQDISRSVWPNEAIARVLYRGRNIAVRLADNDDDPIVVHVPYPECSEAYPHKGSTCASWKGDHIDRRPTPVVDLMDALRKALPK